MSSVRFGGGVQTGKYHHTLVLHIRLQFPATRPIEHIIASAPIRGACQGETQPSSYLPRELEVASPGGLDLLACGLEVVRLRGWQGHHTGRGLIRELGRRNGHHELREEFRLPI